MEKDRATLVDFIKAAHMIEKLNEAAYAGNLGFEEMVHFYRKANDAQEQEMERILQHNDWEGYKKLIYKVLGKKLV
jgi:hypothetical protein